jgi:hypothetical protein
MWRSNERFRRAARSVCARGSASSVSMKGECVFLNGEAIAPTKIRRMENE